MTFAALRIKMTNNYLQRITEMNKSLVLSGLALLLAAGAHAQSTNITLPPGKLAIFKGGDNTGIWNISTARVQPCFVQVFDPVTINQPSPLVSLALPTNAPDGIWINAHAGSEGGGISRTSNRQFLALEAYTGNILTPTSAKPSSDPTVTRGFGVMDAFGNEHVLYSDLANWFGMPPLVTQNNPTGIASTDGTNFWGTGNEAGTRSEATGTLFYNPYAGGTPSELQNYIQAAAEARIINGTLYIAVIGGGIYNFLDPLNNDVVVPLPYDPNVPNPVQHPVLTNLFINWGSSFSKVANFDMNAAGTIAYGADQTKGIVKFVNNSGVWTQAPYFYSTTNIGTTAQSAANQGCFGVCVDFSGANPIIYATTMENGTAPPKNGQGHQNQNRLIRIVDTGVNPGISLVAQTLATATTTNEFFGGIDFTPDLTPLITSQPANYSTTNGGSAFFAVGADSVYPLAFQWMTNGVPLGSDATNSTLALSGLDTNSNGFLYQCVVSNQYGVVTSAPPALLTVSLTNQPPVITNSAAHLTAFVGGLTTFAPIAPTGTEPFTFQWYHGATQVNDDGVKYSGSTTASLTISNLVSADAGNYSLVANNGGGFASNVVDVLTVNYHLATIAAGQPASQINFVGLETFFTANQSGATPPVTNQWFGSLVTTYKIITTNTVVTTNGVQLSSTTKAGPTTVLSAAVTNQLAEGATYSGTTTPTLAILSSQLSDNPTNVYLATLSSSTNTTSVNTTNAGMTIFTNTTTTTITSTNTTNSLGTFSVVYTNPGGSVTSQVATVTVLVPPPHSSVSYSNQVYLQNFDTLPDPGSSSVNSINNPMDPGSINGLTYSLANPFDFTFPVIGGNYLGGLGLSTLPGWYGAADTTFPGVDGITRFGAQNGDQTTGGVIDFGPNDSVSVTGTNRALGLLSTSTTGSTTFGLKLINTSTQALNYVDLSFIGELWHNGTGHRLMSFGYTIDPTATSFTLTSQSISNATLVPELAFSFPTNIVVTTVDGTQPANQTSLATNNLQLSSPWPVNGALWLLWSIDFYGSGSGNGYAIDNLSFSATVNPVIQGTAPLLGNVAFAGGNHLGFSFTNIPGATFSVYGTTNLAKPISWTPLGPPTETPNTGFSTYSFTDTHATNSQRYYKVTSP